MWEVTLKKHIFCKYTITIDVVIYIWIKPYSWQLVTKAGFKPNPALQQNTAFPNPFHSNPCGLAAAFVVEAGNDAADLSGSWVWARHNFLVTTVQVTLWLPITRHQCSAANYTTTRHTAAPIMLISWDPRAAQSLHSPASFPHPWRKCSPKVKYTTVSTRGVISNRAGAT